MKSEEHSVRVQFEIGHEASLKSKKTPEGFTHDWEVFVRGADNTEIQYFVEKVVFHLHETFQKPKRVIKEPPYSVKESGYAGFIVPIDVYLKNKEEPKKIKFHYDLNLQTSGPPISHVMREPRVFQNPSEDFRRKLIRGGGVGVDDASKQHKTKTESPVKKPKLDLPLTNSFADLFGPPIRKVTPEPKKQDSVKKVEPEQRKSQKSPHKEKEKNSDKKEKNKEKPKPVPVEPPLPPPPPKKEEHKKHDEKKHEKKKEEKKPKEEKEPKVEKIEIKETKKETKVDAVEKEKIEKHKRKHKKKEKERDKEKVKKEEAKDKKKKQEESKEKIVRKSRSPSPPREKSKKGPLNTLLEGIGSSYSPSSLSEDEESISSLTSKTVPEKPVLNSKPKSTNLNSSSEKSEDSRYKKKIKKVDEKKKRKERSVSSEREEERVKREKEELEEKERLEKEKQRLEKERLEKEASEKVRKEKKHKRERGERSEEPPVKKKEQETESKCDKFSKEYVAQLRDLQHRIMTLEDSAELQKVVQVIAETGLYEITKKTFDFDLCDLDVTTVKKLQDFFATT